MAAKGDGEDILFDEMFMAGGGFRWPCSGQHQRLEVQHVRHLQQKSSKAGALFRSVGVTFNVYGNKNADEWLVPYEMVPRMTSVAERSKLNRGIEQRIRAIISFSCDMHHRQEIIRDGTLPARPVTGNSVFLPQLT